MATLGVCSDIDPSADPVPDQTMLPTVSLTESDIPRAGAAEGIFKWGGGGGGPGGVSL